MMTVYEAIHEIRQVGVICAENGKLKVCFPETERGRLEPAIEALRKNRDVALKAVADAPAIPPAQAWPESLRELAEERATVSANPDAARKEVWISWCEWKARELNRLFLDQGVTGQPGRITAETVRDGQRRPQK